MVYLLSEPEWNGWCNPINCEDSSSQFWVERFQDIKKLWRSRIVLHWKLDQREVYTVVRIGQVEPAHSKCRVLLSRLWNDSSQLTAMLRSSRGFRHKCFLCSFGWGIHFPSLSLSLCVTNLKFSYHYRYYLDYKQVVLLVHFCTSDPLFHFVAHWSQICFSSVVVNASSLL